MKIAELKKKFKNTWVLAEVLKEDRLNRPIEVVPIISSDDRDELYDKLDSLPNSKKIGKTFTNFYTGKMTGAILY